MFGHNNPPSRGPPPNHPMHHQPPPNMSGMGQSHGPPPNIVNQPPPPVHSNVVQHPPVHPSGVPPPSHVPFVGGERVVDWIEQIKKDYLTLEQEYLQCKHHRDELERKLESQISEFQLMHTAIYDLENGFTAAKQHYEDRIQQLNATVIELKQQLGQQQQQDNSHYPVPNGQVPPSQYLNAPSQQMHMGRDNFGGNPSGLSTLPPPNLQNPSSQSLPSMMSNQPPSNLSQTLNGSSPPLPPIGVNSGNPQVNNGGMGGNHLPPYSHDGYQQQGNKPPQQSGGGSRASPFPGNGPALNNPPPNNEMLMPMHNVPPNGSTLPSIQPPKQNGNIPINTSSVGPTPVNTNVSQATQHIIERPKSVNNSQIHNPPQQTNGNPNLQQSAQTNGILPPQQTTNQVNLFDQRGNENVVKKEGNDWVVVYNPQVTATTNLNMSLYHNLDQESVVCCVKFSSCGRYLATGSNKQAIVFDVDTGKKFGTFSTIGPVGSSVQHEDDEREEQQSKKPSSNDQDEVIEGGMKEDSYIRSVCFSPDSKYLVAGADDKTVKIWDVESKQIYRSLEGHELDIYSLDFSPDSRFLVSGSGDGKAKIWDMDSGECRHTCGNEEIGPREGVTSVAISPDGKTVATGSLDCVVRLWDMATGDLIEAFSGNGGHDDSVYSVAFSPDGKTLASGSLDRTLKIWDIKSASCIASLSGHRDFVLSVAYSPDGKWLVSGSKDRSVQFWDPRSNVLHLMLQGHKNSVISVSLNPKRPLFATGSGDFRARVWRYE